MVKLLLFLLVAMIFEAIGVVLINQGLRQIGTPARINPREILRLLRRGATNANLLLGVFCDALFFLGLLILMARTTVSFLWPLTAFGFVLTTLAARVILHEKVSPVRWLGVMFIVAGAVFIIASEPSAPIQSPPPLAVTATNSAPVPR